MTKFMKYFDATVISIVLFALFQGIAVNATLNDVDKQLLAAKNLLTNGGFENGKAGTSATGGSYTLVTYDIPSNGIRGRVTASWDASAADQYLNFGTITYYRWSPVAQKNGIALCSFRSGYSDYTLEVYDGTNVIASQVLSTGGTTSLTKKEYVNFAYPTTTTDGPMTITVRLKSTADATAVLVDDCFLGLADEVNLSAVQPREVYTAFISGTNPDGNGVVSKENVDWISGNCTNADPKVCTFVSGIFSAAPNCVVQAYDATGGLGQMEISAVSATSITIDVNRSAAAGDGATARAFYLTCYKTTTDTVQTAYRADTLANSWSGYHGNTCSWSRTNTAFGDPTADASCALVERTNANFGTVTTYTVTNPMPGIVFTPKKAGRYFVCATVALGTGGVGGATYAARLWDGTTTVAEADGETVSGSPPISYSLCGIYVASSTDSKTLSVQTKASSGAIVINAVSAATSIEWSIFAIDQQLPAPLLVNSVTSNASGVEGVHRAFITNTGTPTISSGDQSGDWIDSITDGAAGVVTVNFKAGVFSRKPACTAMCVHNGTNCTVFAYNNAVEPSTTSIQLVTRNSAGTGVDEDIMLICMGPR